MLLGRILAEICKKHHQFYNKIKKSPSVEGERRLGTFPPYPILPCPEIVQVPFSVEHSRVLRTLSDFEPPTCPKTIPRHWPNKNLTEYFSLA